jgi:hypothetical protein
MRKDKLHKLKNSCLSFSNQSKLHSLVRTSSNKLDYNFFKSYFTSRGFLVSNKILTEKRCKAMKFNIIALQNGIKNDWLTFKSTDPFYNSLKKEIQRLEKMFVKK